MRGAGRLAGVLLWLHAAAAGASTRWKVVDDHGTFWLQGPDSKRILSRGVDCVGPGPSGSDFKADNPTYAPALRPPEPEDAWRSRTIQRLKAWGFNTAAGWSDEKTNKAGLPFTPVLHLGVQMGAPWDDPWEPSLPARSRDMAAKLIGTAKGDPNCIGYFLDNEFGWGDDWILGIALAWPPARPGKRHLVEVLQKVYKKDFAAFSADFETRAQDWNGLLTASATGQRPGRGHRAMDAWVEAVVHQYNVVLAGAVRAVDPGALVLGDRYRQFYPQAVARAARGVLDAVSTNFEARTADGWISPAYFITLHECSGLPVIVGEFYATARQNRSGNRNHGGEFTLTDTQAQRAAVAAAQARAFAAFPFVVGWHWFQWMDEPTYGRDDGEDYNMGLVDIRDVPYDEMVGAFTAANGQAETLHKAGAAALAVLRGDAVPVPLPVGRQEGLTADGKLGDWEKSAPVPRALLRTEAGLRPFGDVFLAWDGAGLRVAVRAYDFSVPAKNTPVAADPATWGDLHRLTVTADGAVVEAATGLVAAAGAAEEAWKPVTFAVPPAAGQSAAAIASAIDRWHYVWEVAIPASALGGVSLNPGRKLWLSLLVENRGDFEKMRIDNLEIILR